MGDVNKTTHTGIAISKPTLTYLNAKTPLAIFTLKVRETWRNMNGDLQSRDNLLKMEALKKNAHWVKTHVKVGHRYCIDGYIRSEDLDGREDIKVRILHIEKEETDGFHDGKRIGIREGLKQAQNLLKNARGVDQAIEMIDIILE